MITLGRTTLRREGRIVVAEFDDGTHCTAHPHDVAACGTLHPYDPTTCNPPAYAAVAIAHACYDYGDVLQNVDAYVWEHELAHVVVGLQYPDRVYHGWWFPPGASRVLWALAHGWPTKGEIFDEEEKQASALQKAWHRLT